MRYEKAELPIGCRHHFSDHDTRLIPVGELILVIAHGYAPKEKKGERSLLWLSFMKRRKILLM